MGGLAGLRVAVQALRDVTERQKARTAGTPSFPPSTTTLPKLSPLQTPEAAFTHCEQNNSIMSKRTSANASNGSAKELTVGEPGMYLSQELQSAVFDLLQLSTSRRSCSLMTTLISPS